jgi:hypothetical protein
MEASAKNGRLMVRRTGCEGGSPRVRYTTARFPHPAWRRRGGGVVARGRRAAVGKNRCEERHRSRSNLKESSGYFWRRPVVFSPSHHGTK